MLLARAPEEAEEHLDAAHRFDPPESEPLALLAALFHERGDQQKELGVVRGWAERAEHDGAVHRRLLELLLDAGLAEEAARAAENAVWTSLEDPKTHLLAARAYASVKDARRADFEYESALLTAGRPEELATVRSEWVSLLEARGQAALAAKVRAGTHPPKP